jgi:hypothetical protein
MQYTSEDLNRLKSYEKVHLKGEDDNLEPGEKVKLLHKRIEINGTC